jgi:hypothetical protein
MTHEEARELIPAFAASRLQGPALDGLRAHLSACPECAELTAGIGGMVSKILEGGSDLLDPHPDEKALRAFFEGSRLPGAERIEKHLRTCASCSLEVATKVHAGSAGRKSGGPEGNGTASTAGLLAAAAGILAVGVLVGVMVTAQWRPRPVAPGASAPGLPAWRGPVDLHVLPSPQRGEAVARFVLKKGQPATILHLPRVFPGGGNPADRLRLLVQSEEGAVKFDRIYARSEMERAFESWGVMPIFLPASILPDGRYEVLVLREAEPPEKIASIPFEIVRE